MSGFRVGFLLTASTKLLDALANVGYFSSVSNDTQHLAAQLLADDAFCNDYLNNTRDALREQYEATADSLRSNGFQFMTAYAGLFLWLDLSAYLPECTFEAEYNLFMDILKSTRVLLTPGRDCHAQTPGWFRLCYAWSSIETNREGIMRLAKHLGSIS